MHASCHQNGLLISRRKLNNFGLALAKPASHCGVFKNKVFKVLTLKEREKRKVETKGKERFVLSILFLMLNYQKYFNYKNHPSILRLRSKYFLHK